MGAVCEPRSRHRTSRRARSFPSGARAVIGRAGQGRRRGPPSRDGGEKAEAVVNRGPCRGEREGADVGGGRRIRRAGEHDTCRRGGGGATGARGHQPQAVLRRRPTRSQHSPPIRSHTTEAARRRLVPYPCATGVSHAGSASLSPSRARYRSVPLQSGHDADIVAADRSRIPSGRVRPTRPTASAVRARRAGRSTGRRRGSRTRWRAGHRVRHAGSREPTSGPCRAGGRCHRHGDRP